MVFLLFFISNLYAHVLQDDVNITDKTPFSFSAVCQKMVTHESPLIEIVSGTELDCMGKKVQVGEFCYQEMAADPYYLRGYVDKTNKKVICVSGKKVLFKYLCTRMSDKEMCEIDSKKACAFIQGKLARRLDLVHDSFTKNEKGIKQLNCFFESLPLKDK